MDFLVDFFYIHLVINVLYTINKHVSVLCCINKVFITINRNYHLLHKSTGVFPMMGN